jgi:SAM-dependent methyltransferase
MNKKKGVDETFDYKNYWDERYRKGQNSGKGSYGANAEFKAAHIHRVVKEYNCKSIADFGCGDGNQLSMFPNISYTGFDISPTIIEQNKVKFPDKNFEVMDMKNTSKYNDIADLSICFDCLFHITQTKDWVILIDAVCNAAKNVIVITTNTYVVPEEYFPHVNFSRKIMPLLDEKQDITIEEVVNQDTDKENSLIVLSKVLF